MKNLRMPSTVEVLTRGIVGCALWACSAYLTVSLFLSMAGRTRGSQIFMAALAIALEGTKILSWRMGGKARYLSYALLALSVVASFGAALKTVQEARTSFVVTATESLKTSQDYESLLKEESALDQEAAVLLKRLGELPPAYATAATRISGTLADIRERKASVGAQRASLENRERSRYDDGNLFVLLGKEFRLAPETVLLVILVFLSLCIEAGALVLTAPVEKAPPPCPLQQRQEQDDVLPGRPRQDSPRTTEAFLSAAMDGADLPYLHGRDATARKLGISSYEAKRLVRVLRAEGRIVAQGKRLRLKRY